MFRSLVFTALMEEPEFGRLPMDDSSRVVTDATERVQKDQAENPSLTIWDGVQAYIKDVTNNRTCEPGIWQRYVNVLRAGDEVEAEAARKKAEIPTPAAAVHALGDTTTHDELLDFASDSTRFDGDIADLF